MKYRVRDSEQALCYLTECTLATVSGMAMKKSRAKGEYERQIAIAQTGIDWIKDFKINPSESNLRLCGVIKKGISVKEWCANIENL